jgi:hypothetical protein
MLPLDAGLGREKGYGELDGELGFSGEDTKAEDNEREVTLDGGEEAA